MHELCTLTNSIQTALVPFGPLPSITKMENQQSAHITIELYCVSFSIFLSCPCDMVLAPDRLAANSQYRLNHCRKCAYEKGILPQCSRPFSFHRLGLKYPQQIVVLNRSMRHSPFAYHNKKKHLLVASGSKSLIDAFFFAWFRKSREIQIL